jgi:tyrosine-specific transport protein
MMRDSRVFGGILLVSGTAIGAAMLALPVSTGLAGFIPALWLFVIGWALMTYTAFLLLEVNFWMEADANMITMAKRTLGIPGAAFAWVCYLFLLYTLTTAYLAVGGPVFLEGIEAILGWRLPSWCGPVPLLLLFSVIVYRGTQTVDYVNRILMVGLVVSFLLLMTSLIPHTQPALLKRTDWPQLLLSVSVVATSFGYHIIIPSLTTYLERDVRRLKLVLIVGSAIPLLVYVLWDAVILSIIPQAGLVSGYLSGGNGASLVADVLQSPWVHVVARFVLFFAIVTSFLGVSLSLWDFLSDGLHISKHGRGRYALYVVTFLPPLAFALIHPRAFLTAIEYAGAFGVMTLLALLPALMIWRGRYQLHFASPLFRAPGGRLALLVVIALAVAVILIECGIQTRIITLENP